MRDVGTVFRVLGVVVLVVNVAVPALAAQGRRVPPAGAAGADAVVTPAEIQRMLDGYMLIQAQDVLQLTDEQFPRFLARVRTWQETRRRMQGERQRMLQELRRMTSGRGDVPDENTVKDRLKGLDDLETRAAGEIQQHRGAIDQVLNPMQQARFRIFEEMMEQRKIELLMRARQGRGRQNVPPPAEEPRN
jgi:Spy/CpxP family protein refolding chaperone